MTAPTRELRPRVALALAIVAGGKSTRMGRDKAELTIAGATMLARLAGLGVALGLPVLVCGRSQPVDWRGPAATFLTDAIAGEGPLRGLEAAFTQADEVLLIACDMPLLDVADLRWLLSITPAVHGTAVSRAGQIEPLFSRYHATCRQLLAAELAAGRRSPARLLAAGLFAQVAAPPAVAAHLADADTPSDWLSLTGG